MPGRCPLAFARLLSVSERLNTFAHSPLSQGVFQLQVEVKRAELFYLSWQELQDIGFTVLKAAERGKPNAECLADTDLRLDGQRRLVDLTGVWCSRSVCILVLCTAHSLMCTPCWASRFGHDGNYKTISHKLADLGARTAFILQGFPTSVPAGQRGIIRRWAGLDEQGPMVRTNADEKGG